MDDFQQLVALVDCVFSGKNDLHLHPKTACCLLYGGSVLPLIAAFSLSQRNQELKFLHITPSHCTTSARIRIASFSKKLQLCFADSLGPIRIKKQSPAHPMVAQGFSSLSQSSNVLSSRLLAIHPFP